MFPDVSLLSVTYVKNICPQVVSWLFTFFIMSLGEQILKKFFNRGVWLILFVSCLRNPFLH